MKTLLATILTALFITTSITAQQYSRVEVTADRDQMIALLAKGLPVDDAYSAGKGTWVIELSQDDISKLSAEGLDYEILIEDVSRFYVERNKEALKNLDGIRNARNTLDNTWPVPEGFELGSVGGFCSIDEMHDHLDDMIDQYPDLISQKYLLNYQTHEGRDIYWLRISDNPNTNETGEPEILYTGMHHAREPIGMQVSLFYMYYLLENYPDDPEVQYLVDNFELVFVPMINVDGYAYNIQTNPGGGGMWRKNRRDNEDGSYGVDPNRNYGYQWGLDNTGSSPYTWDETYRGPAPFSEPCVNSMREFCEENEFVNALNYHSYSNLLLYPWGYTSDPCPEDDIFFAHAKIMTKENGYTYGAGSTTIYPTNGGSDDWMYGEQDTKDLIYAYTPEVGGAGDGFWPEIDRIIPQCQENMWQNIMAAKLAGVYAEVRDLSPLIIEDMSGNLDFEIQRLGLKDDGTFTVSIEPVNGAITEVGDPIVFDDLDILQTEAASITYTLDEGIQQGDDVVYVLSVDNGYITERDTISKVYGTPVLIFEDDGETFEKWASNKWSITPEDAHTGEYSITDSPYGNYSNYENNSMILTEPVDLSSAAFAVLKFWAKWEIEAGYDFVQVYVSINGGSAWTPLEGNYTKPGNSNQAPGEPVYDGVMDEWVQEEISLEEFIGEEILLRFRLKSDTYVTGDGFYWDDMEIVIVDIATGVDEGLANEENAVSIYPNPTTGIVDFDFRLPEGFNSGKLMIFNTAGSLVEEIPVEGSNGTVSTDLSNRPSGVYYYFLRSHGTLVSSGKVVRK